MTLGQETRVLCPMSSNGVEWAPEGTGKEEAAEKEKRARLTSSKTLDLAINAAVDAGLHFAVAAGNDNQDTCNYSPAAAEKAVTVSASYLIDISIAFPPGSSLNLTNPISGMFMASPHICRLLSYFLLVAPSSDSDYTIPITPAKLKKRMVKTATPDILTDIPSGTINLLAWNDGVNKSGTSNFSFHDNTSSGYNWKETIYKEFEKIEKEGLEWIHKAKDSLRNEVESAL